MVTLATFGWALLGILLGILITPLWNSTAGSFVSMLKAA
jgi:hypothetical protein